MLNKIKEVNECGDRKILLKKDDNCKQLETVPKQRTVATDIGYYSYYIFTLLI